MKILYWNIKQNENINYITELLSQELPDLFFLAEINKDILQESKKFNDIGYEFFENPGCERITILKKIKLTSNLGLQSRYYTSIEIPSVDLIVISVHLPSQMFQHMKALKEFIRDFRSTIDSEYGSSIESRILVIGDFNVNPFEEPMIDFDGFSASNSRRSRSIAKSINNNEKILYYNPTWQLYSRTDFPGTKYFRRPSGSSYDILEHHYLDQVVISQKLRDEIIKERIDVIEITETLSFFNKEKNIIEGSDHLPLLYEFYI